MDELVDKNYLVTTTNENIDEDSLSHFGVKGMRWGVRNAESSGVGRSSTKSSKKRSVSSIRRAANKKRLKDVANVALMSDKNLDQKIARLEKEKKLINLTIENSKGKSYVSRIMFDIGEKTVKTALTGAALYGAKAFVSGQFNPVDFGNALFYGGAKKK